MYRSYNFCFLLLTRLFLSSCFISGIASAPTETGIDVKFVPEEEFASESKLSENIKGAPKGLNLPFVDALIPGKGGDKDSPASGLPGLPDLSSLTADAKMYLGTFQMVELPVPKMGDFIKMFTNLGNFGNLANLGNLPTLPGFPNPLSSGTKEPSSS